MTQQMDFNTFKAAGEEYFGRDAEAILTSPQNFSLAEHLQGRSLTAGEFTSAVRKHSGHGVAESALGRVENLAFLQYTGHLKQAVRVDRLCTGALKETLPTFSDEDDVYFNVAEEPTAAAVVKKKKRVLPAKFRAKKDKKQSFGLILVIINYSIVVFIDLLNIKYLIA